MDIKFREDHFQGHQLWGSRHFQGHQLQHDITYKEHHLQGILTLRDGGITSRSYHLLEHHLQVINLGGRESSPPRVLLGAFHLTQTGCCSPLQHLGKIFLFLQMSVTFLYFYFSYKYIFSHNKIVLLFLTLNTAPFISFESSVLSVRNLYAELGGWEEG